MGNSIGLKRGLKSQDTYFPEWVFPDLIPSTNKPASSAKYFPGNASAWNKKRGQKFHLSAGNYEWNLKWMSNPSQSTRPTIGEELLKEVIYREY